MPHTPDPPSTPPRSGLDTASTAIAFSDPPRGAFVAAPASEDGIALAGQWRRLNRVATLCAILTAPAGFLIVYRQEHARLWVAIAFTVLAIGAFRGIVDVGARRMIPWPHLFGAEQKLLKEDVIARRRASFWRAILRLVSWALVITAIIWLVEIGRGEAASPLTAWHAFTGGLMGFKSHLSTYAITFGVLMIGNVGILIGPFLLMAVRQIRAYEPGDADWGVRLDHVRGQAEAKAEITRVINLWQSGEEFEKAGGKRERGLLFLGPPGTGKTMLAKAIATGFNCPFVTIPGSGFAGMFIGMDIITVQLMARKARKLARKWGGQCIVFIDEIDAVGMRRSSLQGTAHRPLSIHDLCYHGPMGSLSSTCGMVIETAAWRDKQFADRAEPHAAPWSSVFGNLRSRIANAAIPGGMMGGMGMGQGALNQLLVTMDGIDEPPMIRRMVTRWANSWLDALYVVPQRIGRVGLRIPRAKPTGTQIYFIGACNVPIEALDPALTRPGRMGRHIRFRTPIKADRIDIFDRYLAKVSHESALDNPAARDELGRMTAGYSPAMIEQVCSMALTYAHHDARQAFRRGDLVEAMTTVESGMAIDVKYVEAESRAVAIHEAGHAAASHVYDESLESTRLSIRMRGGSLGHHYAIEKEERFSQWRSEMSARLIAIMGAIAAEKVFYGENSNGVGGDMQAASSMAALMVGAAAMSPARPDLRNRFSTTSEADQATDRVMSHFQKLGDVLMALGSVPEPLSGVLRDRDKHRLASQILGQAYFTAYCFVEQNRTSIEQIAETLIERRELHGDEVVDLLESVPLKAADLNYLEERAWPRL